MVNFATEEDDTTRFIQDDVEPKSGCRRLIQSKSTWYARGCATGVILDFDDPTIQSFSQRRRIKPRAGSSKRLWHPTHFFARVSFQNVISSGYLPALHGGGLDCVLDWLPAPLALDSPTSWISVTASCGLRERFGWDDLGLFPMLFGHEAWQLYLNLACR